MCRDPVVVLQHLATLPPLQTVLPAPAVQQPRTQHQLPAPPVDPLQLLLPLLDPLVVTLAFLLSKHR